MVQKCSPWSPSISLAVKKSKEILHKYKEFSRKNGKPEKNHPLALQKKKCSRAVRAAQRRQNAQNRHQKLKRLSKSHPKDQKTFHWLVRQYRQSGFSEIPIKVEDRIVTDPKIAVQHVAEHYKGLATPADKPETFISFKSSC